MGGGFVRRFVFSHGLFVRLCLVMFEDPANAFFVPTFRKLWLLHFDCTLPRRAPCRRTCRQHVRDIPGGNAAYMSRSFSAQCTRAAGAQRPRGQPWDETTGLGGGSLPDGNHNRQSRAAKSAGRRHMRPLSDFVNVALGQERITATLGGVFGVLTPPGRNRCWWPNGGAARFLATKG
jgi:hypothetical protein